MISNEFTFFVIFTSPNGRTIDLLLKEDSSSFNSLFNVGEINLF